MRSTVRSGISTIDPSQTSEAVIATEVLRATRALVETGRQVARQVQVQGDDRAETGGIVVDRSHRAAVHVYLLDPWAHRQGAATDDGAHCRYNRDKSGIDGQNVTFPPQEVLPTCKQIAGELYWVELTLHDFREQSCPTQSPVKVTAVKLLCECCMPK